jgi:crotonobetainyl-CoA:carnitine CoA-transferase CaiB-like acyl-CoA transferase
VRVLDLSRVLAGPWATQVLADLGAEVVKVERPGTGDETRTWGPPWLGGRSGDREAAYFASANRGKRSVTVDLSRPEGQAIVRRLAAWADVLFENYKVGALARWGLAYEHLAAVNPRLVYCSISGFGQDGPSRDRAGYDFLVQAVGGLMSITGERDGPPVKVGVAVTDLLTGMYAATAALAALAERERSGLGQHVDLALLDVQVAALANQAESFLVTGRAPARMGNAHPSIVPYQAFATSDGWMVVAVGNDPQFARLAEVVGRPELARDARFATNGARVANRDALSALLSERLRTQPTDRWVRALEGADVPAGPINDVAQVFDDPQVRHRGLRTEVARADGERVPVVASPIRLSRTPVRHGAPPRLGEHTREVLVEVLGMADEEVEALRAAKVI